MLCEDLALWWMNGRRTTDEQHVTPWWTEASWAAGATGSP